MENVEQVFNDKNRPSMMRFITALNDLGYHSTWQVLNATDFNIPQHRRRCFMVSSKKGRFVFPRGPGLSRRLKDMLEDDVGPAYNIPEPLARTYTADAPQRTPGSGIIISGKVARSYELAQRVYDSNGTCPTITACSGGGVMPKIIDPRPCRVGIVECPYTIARKVWSPEGTSPACTAAGGNTVPKVGVGSRIRYLTPRECFRLMGQRDDAIDRILEAVPSKHVQYKLAGNSIVVDVLEAIFRGALIDRTFNGPDPQQVSMEAFL